MKYSWILGSRNRDLTWLYLPGLLGLLLSFSILRSTDSALFVVYAFLATQFFDSGHVYTTLWRTYFNPAEVKRDSAYLYIPFVFFFIFLAWGYFQIPHLSSFIVYATIFHNVRQFQGLNKWYQRINNKIHKKDDYFLYFNCGMPFLIAHFRTGYVWNQYYSPEDIFRFPNELLYKISLAIYALGLLVWIYRTKISAPKFSFNNWLPIAFPSLLYGVSFIVGQTAAEIVFPLIIAHGCAYMAVMSLSMNRTQPRFQNLALAVSAVILIALVFGSLESVFEENYLDLTSRKLAPWVALYLTPLFCHYYFDAFIWTGRHPEAQNIFKPS